jgi:hypothetical protein
LGFFSHVKTFPVYLFADPTNVEMRGTTKAVNHLTLLTEQSSIVRLVSNATQRASLISPVPVTIYQQDANAQYSNWVKMSRTRLPGRHYAIPYTHEQ